MPLRLRGTLTLAALAVSLILPASARADIPWTSNLAYARGYSAAQKRPILISFYADWCSWSRRMDADVYAHPVIQQAMRNFIPVKLDAEGNGAGAASYFNVEGLPTTIILSPDGRVIQRISGYVGPGTMLTVLRSIGNSAPAAPAPASPGTKTPSAAVPGAPSNRPATESIRQETINRESPPQWSVIKSSSGGAAPSGVYILDENGATRIDDTAKKAPAKTPKSGKSAGSNSKKS